MKSNTMNPTLKFLLELGPLLVFAVLNFRYGINPAILAFVVLAPIAMAITWWIEGHVTPIQWIGTAMILFFGGLAIYLDQPWIYKIKPTIASGFFALVLIGAYLIKRPFIKALFGSAFEMPDSVWLKLTLRWGLFFVAMAIANEIAWRNLSDVNWGWFKVALFPVSIIFGALQAPLMMKYVKQDES